MKTLIFNGSPREQGDTTFLVKTFLERLQGENLVVRAYGAEIQPCTDCRYCWTNDGCVIQDEMQQVYQFIEDCDCILMASPIYFSELTGPLLSVASRLQMYFCARHFRKISLIQKAKIGGVILVGGGDGSGQRANETARILLKHMNCQHIEPMVCSHDTNHVPAREDAKAIAAVRVLADRFNAFGECVAISHD